MTTPHTHHNRSSNYDFYLIGIFAENQEKFYLYLIISVTAGVLICLTLLVLRLLCHRRHTKAYDHETDMHETSFQKSNTGETTIPNGFSDDISEIDADIDLTATLPISSVTRSDVSSEHVTISRRSPFVLSTTENIYLCVVDNRKDDYSWLDGWCLL